MSELAILTPTFRGDAELFSDLHRSVLMFTPRNTVHHVVVPPGDRKMFSPYEGTRCRVWTSSDLFPRRYVRLGKRDSYVNTRMPWPPIRGWIAQQALKISAAARIDADTVLIVDSDVVLVRNIRANRFRANGQPILHRETGAVTEEMERHIIWHRVGRELLGLPPAPPPPLTDYVSSFNFWQPTMVAAMCERISQTTGQPWVDAFTSQLHISEFMLYGIFIDEVVHANRRLPPTNTALCHNTWQRTPLDQKSALTFAEAISPEAIAMMISAKSHTPIDIRRAAIQRCAEIVAFD